MGLDTVELVLSVEQRFAISISDQDAEKVETVGDLVGCVRDKLLAQGRSTPDEQMIFEVIKQILITENGIDERKINLTATFIDDLRLD